MKMDNHTPPEKLTSIELKEMINRQNLLIANKKFISKLPDKGEKLKINLEKLTIELKKRSDVESSVALFSKLTINEPSKSNFQDIEWKGRYDESKAEVLDSDDDSEPEDPIKILAQNTEIKKKIVILKDVPLISEKDLDEIKNFNSEDDQKVDKHTQHVCDYTVNQKKPTMKGSFKPYKTTKTDVHDYAKDLLRCQKKNWDASSATPPPLYHGPVKEIPLLESLQLQKLHNQHLKEIQAKNAAEKLASQLGISIGEVPASSIATQNYRDPLQENDETELNSEDEVHDDDPGDVGVSFPVQD